VELGRSALPSQALGSAGTDRMPLEIRMPSRGIRTSRNVGPFHSAVVGLKRLAVATSPRSRTSRESLL
jgi:hypothetical protein